MSAPALTPTPTTPVSPELDAGSPSRSMLGHREASPTLEVGTHASPVLAWAPSCLSPTPTPIQEACTCFLSALAGTVLQNLCLGFWRPLWLWDPRSFTLSADSELPAMWASAAVRTIEETDADEPRAMVGTPLVNGPAGTPVCPRPSTSCLFDAVMDSH